MRNKKVFIIAEIGINHNGNFNTAVRLIKKAKFCGADAVKFQSFIPSKVVTQKLGLANYQKLGRKKQNEKMLQMLNKHVIDQDTQINLARVSKKYKIEFISSAFDMQSLNFLIKKIRVKTLKIPSGEITNYPYLAKISKSKKNIILSTGMSNISEISQALRVLKKGGIKKNKIQLLHCNSSYPTPLTDINLKSINYLQKKFKIEVGLSDHTTSVIVPSIAVALGARTIEKHFTLDQNQKGPDHRSSLDPINFKNMVSLIRQTEISLGQEKKIITKSEKPTLKFARKSIVAKRNIKRGEKFTVDNLTTKRPGIGLSPMLWNKILKKKSNKNFKKDDLIKLI